MTAWFDDEGHREHEGLCRMIEADDLLARLKALAPSQEITSLEVAGQEVDAFLSEHPGGPGEKAAALAALQTRFQREATPSVMRSEILDMLSDRVVRLLEAH